MIRRMMMLGATIGLAAACPGGAWDLSWHAVDGGGADSAGADLQLSGTMAQPDAGRMAGGAFELTGGFWAARGAPPCSGDADGDGQVNIADLGLVLAQFNSVGSGLLGDVDDDGDVDIGDLGIVLANFGTSCA